MDKLERRFWAAAILIFASFVGILYYPVLFGKVPFPRDMVMHFPAWAGRVSPAAMRSYADIGDLITYFYPTRAFAAQSVKQGVLPLWNPRLLSGEPFLANAQSSLFYPLNIPYYVLPLHVAWAVCIMLRMFLASLFMAMVVRSIGGSKTGSIFSGIVFGACGFMTAWQGQPMSDSAIWLPFVCYAIQKLHEDVHRTWIALAALGFAMPVLAGHPETAAHVTLIGSTLALTLWAFSPGGTKPRFNSYFIAGFCVVGLLALGVASVQAIPTLEWLKQNGETFDFWPPLPLRDGLGWVSRDILQSPNSAGIPIPEATAYMAMVGMVAAPLAAFHRPRIYPAFLFGVALIAIAIAYGLEPIQTLVSHIPVFRALKNFRMVVANFAVAGMAGLGISALEKSAAWVRQQRLAALALITSTFAFTLFLIHQVQVATKIKPEVMYRPSFSRSLLIISLILIAWKVYGGLKGRIFAIAVCAFAMFDLGTFAFGYTGFAARDEIFPSSPAFDFLLKDQSPYRAIEVGLPYSSNATVMYGIDSADGYEIDFPKQQRAFLDDLILPAVDANGINFISDRILKDKGRRLDLLNIKYVVVPAFGADFKQFSQSDRFTKVFANNYVSVFQNPTALPRAWIVPATGMETFTNPDMEVARLKNPEFDPLKSVTITGKSAAAPSSSAVDFRSSVEITNVNANGLTIKTQSSAPGILVVSQTYYPGWKATVDGTNADILQADGTLTGVPFPAGTHEMRLVFQPASFRIGLFISIIATTILLALLATGLRTERQRAKRNAVAADKVSEIAIG